MEKYPFLAEHPHLGRLKRMAVAAHHAGHLPHYKLMVEELMTHGLLDAILPPVQFPLELISRRAQLLCVKATVSMVLVLMI